MLCFLKSLSAASLAFVIASMFSFAGCEASWWNIAQNAIWRDVALSAEAFGEQLKIVEADIPESDIAEKTEWMGREVEIHARGVEFVSRVALLDKCDAARFIEEFIGEIDRDFGEDSLAKRNDLLLRVAKYRKSCSEDKHEPEGKELMRDINRDIYCLLKLDLPNKLVIKPLSGWSHAAVGACCVAAGVVTGCVLGDLLRREMRRNCSAWH